MSSLDAKIYIKECLPQTTMNEDLLSTYAETPSKVTKTENDENIPLSEMYQKHFQNLEAEMGGDAQARSKV
jgi:hypothetical protein